MQMPTWLLPSQWAFAAQSGQGGSTHSLSSPHARWSGQSEFVMHSENWLRQNDEMVHISFTYVCSHPDKDLPRDNWVCKYKCLGDCFLHIEHLRHSLDMVDLYILHLLHMQGDQGNHCHCCMQFQLKILKIYFTRIVGVVSCHTFMAAGCK